MSVFLKLYDCVWNYDFYDTDEDIPDEQELYFNEFGDWSGDFCPKDEYEPKSGRWVRGNEMLLTQAKHISHIEYNKVDETAIVFTQARDLRGSYRMLEKDALNFECKLNSQIMYQFEDEHNYIPFCNIIGALTTGSNGNVVVNGVSLEIDYYEAVRQYKEWLELNNKISCQANKNINTTSEERF